MSETTYHYVIVRADLLRGVQAAQMIHAAGESCEGLKKGTHAIALHVRDEEHLYEVRAKLWKHEIPHVTIYEDDHPYDGQAMAIGIFPTSDRERVRHVTSSLPLLR